MTDSRSEMDGSRLVLMSLLSVSTVDTWLRPTWPSLVIRCKENSTELYFNAGTSFDTEYGLPDQATVRLRIDGAAPYREVWSESTDGDAVFAPRAISLARRLYRADTLRVEFTPFNHSPQVATFALEGIEQHLPKVASTCGWRIDG